MSFLDFMRGISKRLLVMVLTAVFLVSGSITTLLVFAQMIPDIQNGRYNGMGDGSWQDYSQEWVAVLPEGGTVGVDLDAVQVEVAPWDGDEIKMSFDGEVLPQSDGSVPEIISTVSERRFALSLHGQSYINIGFPGNIGFSGGSAIRGTLTVQLPEDIPLHLAVELFSGNVSVRDYTAAGLTLSTSSGAIEATNMEIGAEASLTSFSGGVDVNGLTAGALTLESDSGGITAQGIQADSLEATAFSGDATLRQLRLEGNAAVETSGGKVEIDGFQAKKLDVNGFSGKVTLAGGQLSEKLSIDASSGGVSCEGVTVPAAEIITFSGDIDLPGLNAGALDLETSGGMIYALIGDAATVSCNTFSGGVTLEAPEDYRFTADLTTFSGEFEIGYPIQLSPGGDTEDELHGTVGGGGSKITVETSSGDIAIRPAGQR
jgi:DUF4097 and DUF4098 domain-containing protein YvlB